MRNRNYRPWFNAALRFLALSICGGLAVLAIPLPFLLPSWRFLIGATLSAVVAWPLFALLDWKFSRLRFRYIAVGFLLSVCGWWYLFNPFDNGAWQYIWKDTNFWMNGSIFLAAGLSAGVLYTALAAAINSKFPRAK